MHLGNELVVAFFRVQETGARYNESSVNGWISTDLTEISPNDTLDFDLYVYMPLNKKFILYRRAGMTLEKDERDALRFHDVQQVHLKADSIEALQRYKAKTYVNSLIWDYRQDNTERSAA